MGEGLSDLTDQQLLNAWKAAKELDLAVAFIALIEQELQRRGIDTHP